MQTSPELLTTAETADRLGLSVATVNRWAKSGRLLSFDKFPGRTGPRLFDPADIDAAAAGRA